MKRPTKVLTRHDATVARWRSILASQDETRFARTPPDGGWSLAQVCDHVAVASEIALDHVHCLVCGDGTCCGGKWMPAAILRIGTFMPVRYKVPEGLTGPYARMAMPEVIPIEAADARLRAIDERAHALHDKVLTSDRKQRIEHPTAGWLNAVQWYQLAEMHMRHHLRQAARIEKAWRRSH